MVFALQAPRGFTRRLHSRKQEPYQNADDCDYNQEFNERESSLTKTIHRISFFIAFARRGRIMTCGYITTIGSAKFELCKAGMEVYIEKCGADVVKSFDPKAMDDMLETLIKIVDE
jgi:hypothetical protein